MAPLGLGCLVLNRLLLPLFYEYKRVDSPEARQRAEWLDTPFDGGRHARRIQKIAAIEAGRDPATVEAQTAG